MNFIRSIVGKMWLATVVLVVITFLVLGGFLTQLLENFYYNLKQQEMVQDGLRLAQSISHGDNYAVDQLKILEDVLGSSVMVVNRNGLVKSCGGMMGMQPGTKLNTNEVTRVLNGEIVTSRGFNAQFDMAMLNTAVPVKHQDEVIGAVLIYTPVQPISQTIADMRRIILLAGFGALMLATVLGFFMTKRLSLPLLQMKNIAHRMASGDFKGRIPIKGDDEIGLLGKSLNFLAGELENHTEALSREKEKFANIVSSMSDGVITLDSSGITVFLNDQAKELLHLSGGQLDQAEAVKFKQWMDRIMDDGSSIKGELKTSNKIIAVRMSPLWDKEQPVGAVALLQDVTKERELERLRKEFLASVSHELRTPLTYLQGYAEAMQDGMAERPEDREQYIKIFLDETLRLRRLVSDLMDLTQMENGKMAMNMDMLDLGALAQQVTEKMYPFSVEKDVRLLCSAAEGVLVYGDADRLQQVLVNLIDNALRHTPSGEEIIISVLKNEAAEIKIKDTGSGIPEEELDYVWERFYKVDKARTRKDSGTGLGLAIVKNIIDGHDGKVFVTSKVGKGTEFTCVLPLADSGSTKINSDPY